MVSLSLVQCTQFLLQIENAECEVADEIYEAYTNLLVQTDENCHFCYKTYMVSNLCMLFILCLIYNNKKCVLTADN